MTGWMGRAGRLSIGRDRHGTGRGLGVCIGCVHGWMNQGTVDEEWMHLWAAFFDDECRGWLKGDQFTLKWKRKQKCRDRTVDF